MSLWVAAVAAGVAAGGLAAPGASGLRRLRRVPADVARQRTRARPWWLLAVGAVVVAGFLGGGAALAVALALAAIVVTVTGLVGRHRTRVQAARRRAEVAEAARVLAGLLRVGVVPSAALDQASGCPALDRARAEQKAGGDVVAALRRSAETPGQEGMADLAAAWAVGSRTGASLVVALEAVAASLAEAEEAERTVDVELAAPRAGGRVLGALPLVGLALGFGLGGNPLDFLLGTPLGWVCGVTGVVLNCAGVWWSDAVATRTGKEKNP